MAPDFEIQNKQDWETAIGRLFNRLSPVCAEWRSLPEIVGVLNYFCGDNLNHTMLPDGGGMDIGKAALSRESGLIELRVDRSMAYLCKPDSLHFQHFPNSPWNSFLLLEAANISPLGIDEEEEGTSKDNLKFEEFLELPNGEYLPRSTSDRGHIGYDERGCEIPIPKPNRVVGRYLGGKFLIVSKSSYWNGDKTGDSYSAPHNCLTPLAIRARIQRAIGSSSPPIFTSTAQ